MPDRNGRDQAVNRGANRDPTPPARNVQISCLDKEVNCDRIAEAGQPQQLPANLLRLPPGPQALKNFLDDRATSRHDEEVVWPCLDSTREHLDPDGSVNEDHLLPRSTLATGVRTHLRKIAKPFDFANMVRQTLYPLHAQDLFQR